MNENRPTLRLVITNFRSLETNRSSREEIKQVTCNRSGIRMTSLLAMLEVRKQWHHTFNILQNNFQPRVLSSVKISIKGESRIRTFRNIQDLKENLPLMSHFSGGVLHPVRDRDQERGLLGTRKLLHTEETKEIPKRIVIGCVWRTAVQ